MEMITIIMTTQIRFNVTVYEADDLFTICKAKTKISHTTCHGCSYWVSNEQCH